MVRENTRPGEDSRYSSTPYSLAVELDALAGAAHLLRQPIDLEIRDPQHVGAFGAGVRRSSALTRTSSSAKSNGLVR